MMIDPLFASLGLWLFIAYTTALVAYRTNRSIVGWLMLGLLVGPFALVTVALLRPLDATVHENPLDNNPFLTGRAREQSQADREWPLAPGAKEARP